MVVVVSEVVAAMEEVAMVEAAGAILVVDMETTVSKPVYTLLLQLSLIVCLMVYIE